MTNGFGKRLVVRLLLTILLTFTVLGTLGSGYAGYLLSSPKVCLSQVEKQQAAAKIHDSVESYFTAQYQTTPIRFVDEPNTCISQVYKVNCSWFVGKMYCLSVFSN